MADAAPIKQTKLGVLAIQGSFREHMSAFKRCGVEAVEVRKPEDLVGLAGLVIPGGESTTMANIAERNGLMGALRNFEASQKPVWGTCAGLIFLADRALGQKTGGQALLGGLDCTVHRNYFGSQLNSFETELPVPPELAEEGTPPTFRAVFIRAPAIIETGPSVQVLAQYSKERDVQPGDAAEQVQVEKVAVAVRQGQLLATAFHPELTSDDRWHKYFVKMVEESNVEGMKGEPPADASSVVLRPINVPKDLPIFGDGR